MNIARASSPPSTMQDQPIKIRSKTLAMMEYPASRSTTPVHCQHHRRHHHHHHLLLIACELVTPRLRCDKHNSKSFLSCGTKVIEPVGERNKLLKVDASFATLRTMAPRNLSACSFSPAATWNLYTTQPSTLPQLTVGLSISPVCCEQRIKHIEW
jgi:hypothetical protein